MSVEITAGIAGQFDGAVDHVMPFQRKRSATPAWVTEVTHLVEDLRAMNSMSESDFLAMGDKLMGFLSAARQIRTSISQLTEYIVGESGERSCNALENVLDRSTEMQKRVEEARQILNSLHPSARAIQKSFSGFHGIALSFQVAATLARIETARLGTSQTNLVHLADNVKSCVAKIRNRVEHAVREAVRLERSIGVTIQHASALDVEQMQALPRLVGDVKESLQAFRLRQQLAVATSARLADEFAAFSRRVNDIVAALQFHDITRQRIEHVIESLEQVLTMDDSRGPSPSPEALAVMELQRQQLLATAESFAESVQRVKQDLKRVADGGREMEEQTRNLLTDRQSSFFDQMERCFAEVLVAVTHCTALNDETAKTTTELHSTVAGLNTCVSDIREIELEINYLSINATIQAIHLGAAGEPLSVVAGAMRTLHATAETRAQETDTSLAVLREAVSSMSPLPAQVQAPPGPSSSAIVIDELRAGIDELHASNERGVTCTEQISAVVGRLRSDVLSAFDDFTVGVLVQETLDRSCGILLRIGAESGVRQDRTSAALDDLRSRYTMLAERDVHQRTAAPYLPNSSSAEPASTYAPAMPHQLGDNVELF